jgi:hypothetical protein
MAIMGVNNQRKWGVCGNSKKKAFRFIGTPFTLL